MSSIVHKIKDAVVHPEKHHAGHSEPEGTHGPHGSKLANAADPRVDSDRDGSHALGNTTHGHTTAAQKFDGPASHTAGPHKSDAMNKLDPRVDSDKDNSRTLGGPASGAHAADTTTGRHAEGTHGPHSSRLANAADPRVDSDRDASHTVGGGHTHPTTGGGITSALPGTHHGTHGTHGTTGGITSALPGTHQGAHGTHGTTGGSTGLPFTSGNTGAHGPHDSTMMNAMDPRVDSDRDGSYTLGGHGHGTTGTYNPAGFGGVDSTIGRVGGALAGTHGTGPAPKTAGPHRSDMVNKADPRIDSDLDGSRTLGTDRTYAQS